VNNGGGVAAAVLLVRAASMRTARGASGIAASRAAHLPVCATRLVASYPVYAAIAARGIAGRSLGAGAGTACCLAPWRIFCPLAAPRTPLSPALVAHRTYFW